jgi:pSer/pThr/pTyr-binding forkhead associated (FHA) protein
MAKIKIERGIGEGTSYFIEKKATLGSEAREVDIAISDSKVSRLHARISYVNRQYYLEDLGSKNGTFLNGIPINKKTPLEAGDYIRIGLTWLSFGDDIEIKKLRKQLKSYEILEELDLVNLDDTGTYGIPLL